MSILCVEELESSHSRIFAKAAPIIVAVDEANEQEPVLLYDCGGTGEILQIILRDGDALFETDSLRKVVEFVLQIKGSCCFQMSHDGIAYPDESSWPDPLLNDAEKPWSCNDDDSSDWWKRGDV